MIVYTQTPCGDVDFWVHGFDGTGYFDADGTFHFTYWNYEHSSKKSSKEFQTEIKEFLESERQKTMSNKMTILKAQQTRPTSWVNFENHVYRIIESGTSKYTELDVDPGYVALFNVKSRTIRAIPSNSIVEIQQTDRNPCRDFPLSKDRIMNTQRLTALEVEASKNKEAWNQILNAERVLSGVLEEDQTSVLVGPLNNLAEKVMQERGFRCLGIVDFVPNNVFYPPTVVKHTATELSWDRHE